jgi:hypothetical protein
MATVLVRVAAVVPVDVDADSGPAWRHDNDRRLRNGLRGDDHRSSRHLLVNDDGAISLRLRRLWVDLVTPREGKKTTNDQKQKVFHNTSVV